MTIVAVEMGHLRMVSDNFYLFHFHYFHFFIRTQIPDPRETAITDRLREAAVAANTDRRPGAVAAEVTITGLRSGIQIATTDLPGRATATTDRLETVVIVIIGSPAMVVIDPFAGTIGMATVAESRMDRLEADPRLPELIDPPTAHLEALLPTKGLAS